MQNSSAKRFVLLMSFQFCKLNIFLFSILFSIDSIAQPSIKDSAKNQKTQKEGTQPQLGMELYGFVLTNVIYDFKQMDPKWFDAPRPTKLPAYKEQFAPDGQLFFSMRQTRFGVKGYTSTPIGNLSTLLEFDLFGSGTDAGQTTIHLRHAYGEVGKFGVGQTWSPFMDPDLLPNDLEYWGPAGMAFIRNIQLRFMPIQGNSKLTIALEKPGATADEGVYVDHVELKSVKANFKLPDLTAQYRVAKTWGHIQLAGIIRQLRWHDTDSVPPDMSGHKTGWGLNLTTKIKCVTNDAIHAGVVYGEGIENYMRDAPADLSIKDVSGIAEPVTLPLLGFTVFYDHNWNKKFSSTFGYSQIQISNSNGQTPSAFKDGRYALADVMYHPIENAMFEIELQYLERKNFSDGWVARDPRIQFSFRFNFSQKFYNEIHSTP